jgi:perosamine synthetase
MTNIAAAIGAAQMETVEQAIADRNTLAGWYHAALAELRPHLMLPREQLWAKQVYWMYTVFLREGGEARRDGVMSQLDEMDIETRPVFYPMHMLPPYRESAAYPVADRWAQCGINLPTHQGMTRADVQRVAEGLRVLLGQS